MKSFAMVAIAAILFFAPIAASQTIIIGTGVVNNLNYQYPTPYMNYYAGGRCQYVVPATELALAGMTTTAISSIGFDVVTPGGAALQGFTIKLGHTAAIDLTGGFDPAPLTTVVGPLPFQDVAGWNDHILQTVFNWNGTDSILVDICFWNGANNWTTSAIVNSSTMAYTASYTEYDDTTPPCGANATFNIASLDRPNMRFSIGGTVPATYETNSPEAHLDINSASSGAFALTSVSQAAFTPCGAGSVTPASGTINVSTLGVPGVVYELVMDTSPLVPLGGGGLNFLGGILNLNVTSAANWTYLNGGLSLAMLPFPGLGLPGASGGSLSVPYDISTALDMSIQGAFAGPTFPTGVELTLASELHVSVTGSQPSVPGPTGDDTGIVVDVTAGATCWFPSGISFDGTVYTSIAAEPNGRIMFSTVNDFDNTATVLEALGDAPFLGFWTDLNPSAFGAGTITLSNPAPEVLRMDFVGVIYYGQTVANTFGIQIDNINQIFTIDGLTGIGTHPAPAGGFDNQFLGLSPGAPGLATDPFLGAGTIFASGSSGIPALPTDMQYDYIDGALSPAGLVASLVPGTLNSIDFQYVPGTGFFWLGN